MISWRTSIMLSLMLVSWSVQAAPPTNDAEARALAHAYYHTEDPVERAKQLEAMSSWNERLDEIARSLRPALPAQAPTGYLAGDRFTVPRLRAQLQRLLPKLPGPFPEGAKVIVQQGQLKVVDKSERVLWSRPYPDPQGPIPQLISRDAEIRDTAFHLRYAGVGVAAGPKGRPAPDEEFLNYVFVPTDYSPSKSYGLVIDLHGGAGNDALDQGAARSQVIIDFTLRERCHDVIRVNLGVPKVAPLKWSFPESEIHLAAVIEEYSTRYNIDPDRIFLTGVSMGGIGGFWHAFRHGDRFAMIRPVVGNYIQAYWPKLRGTFLFFASGVFDSGNTRVDWSRLAHERLQSLDIFHLDGEFPDGHVPVGAGPQDLTVEALIRTVRRNPYPPRACAVSPYTPASPTGSPIYLGTPEQDRARFPAQPYSFWVSVEQMGDGAIAVEQFDTLSKYPQHFALQRVTMPAGAADAENLGHNRFRVTTTNVKRFALWLHPQMGVDMTKPVQIEWIEQQLDPQTLETREQRRRTIERPVRPSLAAMMQYLGDRRDLGLIYHAKVDVSADAN